MSYSENGTNITYKYDADGLRTQKIVNGVQHDYFYEDGQLLYEIKDGVYELYYKYDADGNLFSITRYRYSDGLKSVYYAVTNTRGDVIELRDQYGAIYAKYTYDSWGKLVSATNATGGALTTGSLGYQNSIRYRGYVYDHETGLYYLQSRYYDPEVGRFLNADDVNYIGLTGTNVNYNAFAYCGNNPINSTDPLGTVSAKDFLDVLKKCIDAIKDIIGFISDSYNKELKALKSSIKLLSKKQLRTKKNLQSLINQCNSVSKKLGKLGRFITAATFIYIISSTIKYPSEFPNQLTTFLIEKVLDLLTFGITELVKRLPRAVPGVGYLAGIICSVVAEVVMSAYFTNSRINKITKKFIPYFKKISGKISVSKILSTGFKAIYA